MRFRIFAPLHYMRLDNVKSKGKRIKVGEYNGRLTNSSEEFEKYLNLPHLSMFMDSFSVSEFTGNNSTYIY